MLPKEISALLPKVYSYCAYQERCRSEILEKLREVGVPEAFEEACLAFLAAENFWNEARFAEQFAHGKFKVKRWGKQRIRYELRQREVPETLIQQALAAISPQDYAATLHHLAAAKAKELPEALPDLQRRNKIAQHLLQKGYAWEDIAPALDEVLG